MLEIVDDDEAIVRAWYWPAAAIGEEPTFVDLWLQKIDTRDLAAGRAASFPQVFHDDRQQAVRHHLRQAEPAALGADRSHGLSHRFAQE